MKSMNGKYKLIWTATGVIAAIIIVVLGIWTGIDRTSDKAEVDLYFINADGTGIVSAKASVRYRDDDELVYNTLEMLRRGPSSSKYGEVMPRDTEIKRVVLTDTGRLAVEFSGEFLLDDVSKNVINTYAVVKTLCSTPRVSSVKVLVDGRAITDRDGNKLDYISASDINLEAEEYHSEVRQVALYFANKEGTQLVREMRTIKITDQQPIEQYIINELIKGTENKELKSLLSENTVLVSVDVEDNICYLNFKSNFISENSGESDKERLTVYSIVNSLTELQTIEQVQFYMDGKRVENFGSIRIKDYFHRDTTIIDRR